MNTNLDLKKIWNKQATEIPEIKTLYYKANRYKRKNLQKLIAVNILLLITSVFIGSIWYYYQPELITTKLGIISVILAMLIFIVSYNKQFPLLSKSNMELNSKEYLLQLIKLKERQIFQQTTMLSIYFIILSLGIGLYLFEYVSKLTVFSGIAVYGITTLWIGVNWFYLKPKTIKKQNVKMNNLLLKFKEINDQINS